MNQIFQIIFVSKISNFSSRMIETEKIFFIVFMSFIFVVGTIANVLTIIVYRKNYTRCASIFLIFALAVVNFLTSIIVVPLFLLYSLDLIPIDSKISCGANYFLRYIVNEITAIFLGLIAIERYKTISALTVTKLQFVHKNQINTCKISVFCAVMTCSFYSALCFYFYDSNGYECVPLEIIIYYYIPCFICLSLIILLMCALYIKSYLIVRNSTQRIFGNRTLANNNKINTNPNLKDVISFAPDLTHKHLNKRDENRIIEANWLPRLSTCFNNQIAGISNFKCEIKKDHAIDVEEKSNIQALRHQNLTQLKDKEEFERNETSTQNNDLVKFSVKMTSHFLSESSLKQNFQNLKKYPSCILSMRNNIKSLNNINTMNKNPIGAKEITKTNMVLESAASNLKIRKDWNVAKMFILVSFNFIQIFYVKILNFILVLMATICIALYILINFLFLHIY